MSHRHVLARGRDWEYGIDNQLSIFYVRLVGCLCINAKQDDYEPVAGEISVEAE